MNPFEMVVLIVAIVMITSVARARYQAGIRRPWERGPDNGADSTETRQLRDEVQQLKQRIQTLERIAVDKENSLTREIEQLRDR